MLDLSIMASIVTAPRPWTAKYVSGAGIQISANVSGSMFGVEIPYKKEPPDIAIFTMSHPQSILISSEVWVQFPPKGWREMQMAHAVMMVDAVNQHDILLKRIDNLEKENRELYAIVHSR